MALIDDGGEDYLEVPDEDCEFEEDGFWYLAGEDEEDEEFYFYGWDD